MRGGAKRLQAEDGGKKKQKQKEQKKARYGAKYGA